MKIRLITVDSLTGEHDVSDVDVPEITGEAISAALAQEHSAPVALQHFCEVCHGVYGFVVRVEDEYVPLHISGFAYTDFV